MAKSTKTFAQYRDKLDDYYDICNKIKKLFKEEKFPANLYRSIKQTDGYNPILFNVGDEIPNIFPISASMEFEFPAYLWTMPKQYCCLLSINIDDLYSCSVPIVEYNSGVMYENLYSHKNTEYQSEINLKPGIFLVREISDIVLPSLSEYKNLLYMKLGQKKKRQWYKN